MCSSVHKTISLGRKVGALVKRYHNPVPYPALGGCLALDVEDGRLVGPQDDGKLLAARMASNSAPIGHGCAAPLMDTMSTAAALLCARLVVRIGGGSGPSHSATRPLKHA